MLAIGDVLQNRYRVVRQLGHGGMGTVYEAHDERFEISVALKEVLIDLAKIADPNQQQMVARAFEREAKTLALLHHEAFPHVIDYFSEREHQYLIMELIRGEDLGEQLQKRKKPFEFEDVLNWTQQLLDALDYLHTQDNPIIHRDLKPQNMKLTGRGKIKVLDFGIAKGADNKSSSTITNQTFVAATLNYSPIEQLLRVLDPTFREFISQRHQDKVEDILEHNADARSDLYSLGATIYQLITATQPHDTLKRALDLWAGKPDPLPNPMSLNPKIPPYFNTVLLKSMEIDRDSRFVSAAEMQQVLKNYIDNANRTEDQIKQAAWLAEQQKQQTPEIGMQTQIRIAEQQKFLDELDGSSSTGAKTDVLPSFNQPQAQTPFIPPVNEADERRRIAEQQRFLDELDNPNPTAPPNQFPVQQSNEPLTDYGQINPSFGQIADQTNYTSQESRPSFDQTQVSYLDGVMPKQQVKSADATVINPKIQNEAAAPIQFAPATSVPDEKKNPLIWLVPVGVVAALLIIVGLGFAAYVFFPSPKPEPTKKVTYTPSPLPETSNSSSSDSLSNTEDSTSENSSSENNTKSEESLSTKESKSTTLQSTKKDEPKREEPKREEKKIVVEQNRPTPTPKPKQDNPKNSGGKSTGGKKSGVPDCVITQTCSN